MITNFFLALHGIDMKDVWFQQHVATCYIAHAKIDLLQQTFNGRLISRNGGSQDPEIWIRWTIFCEEPLNISVLTINQI